MKAKLTKPLGRRGSALGGLLVGCLLVGVGCRASESGPSDPLPAVPGVNVIVISFDALRQDALGAYGSATGATPNMDEFASRSLVFENAYSVAPVTPTSFAAMFTGLLPTRVFHGWQLRAEATLASLFAQQGYTTVGFINNVQLTPERGFDRGFEEYNWTRNARDEEVLQEVIAWFEDKPEQPFFVWIHFLTPHAPYDIQNGARHLYDEEADKGAQFVTTSGNKFHTTDPDELSRLRELYRGEVWRADQLFGKLIESLEVLSLLDSSLVLLTSDHGEEFLEHGGFQHGRLYEEHLEIPLIMFHPRTSAARDARIVRTVDLLPTLLGVTDQSLDFPVDGVALADREAASSMPVVGTSMTGAKKRWLSLLEWPDKLILTCRPAHALELYNLETDPGEQEDLSAEDVEQGRAMLRRLGRILGGDPCAVTDAAAQGQAETVGLEEESVEALRALGYLE